MTVEPVSSMYRNPAGFSLAFSSRVCVIRTPFHLATGRLWTGGCMDTHDDQQDKQTSLSPDLATLSNQSITAV